MTIEEHRTALRIALEERGAGMAVALWLGLAIGPTLIILALTGAGVWLIG